jgi:hypothetical protein
LTNESTVSKFRSRLGFGLRTFALVVGVGSALFLGRPHTTSAAAPCTNPVISPGWNTSVPQGGVVNFTASATCGGSPIYRWWTSAVSPLNFVTVKNYGASNTYSWDTKNLAQGDYYVAFWVQNNGGAAGSYDAFAVALMHVTAPACTNAAQTASPSASSYHIGASIKFTASALCGGTPVYKFWLGTVNNGTINWEVLKSYGTANTYTLNTKDMATGNYWVAFWVENQGSPSDYDTFAGTNFSLIP